MVPIRTVSACAWARVQSRLNTAAAAAEVFSSVLREVGMVILPSLPCLVLFCRSIWRMPGKVNAPDFRLSGERPALRNGCRSSRRPIQFVSLVPDRPRRQAPWMPVVGDADIDIGLNLVAGLQDLR